MIQARNIDADIFNFGNYSTSEINTGFTWVDGKTIYKKTIVYSDGITANTEKEISHGIANFSRCIKVEAVGFGDNGTCLMIPAINSNGNSVGIWTITNTIIKLDSIGILYTAPIYITLYYTKTN